MYSKPITSQCHRSSLIPAMYDNNNSTNCCLDGAEWHNMNTQQQQNIFFTQYNLKLAPSSRRTERIKGDF